MRFLFHGQPDASTEIFAILFMLLCNALKECNSWASMAFNANVVWGLSLSKFRKKQHKYSKMYFAELVRYLTNADISSSNMHTRKQYM